MVSRKINELQLQREQPERQRLCALTPPQRQRRLSWSLLQPHTPPLPCSPCLWPTARPSPCPFLTAPLHLTAPWSQRGTSQGSIGTAGQECSARHPGGPEQSYAWMAGAGDSTTPPAPRLCRVPTNQACSWQPRCAGHARSQ